MPQTDFRTLVDLARAGDARFSKVSRATCINAARAFANDEREAIRARHEEGEPGASVVHLLSELGDELLTGIFSFAVAGLSKPEKALQKVALCAHGGFGNRELNPGSDLDIGLVYKGRARKWIEPISEYMTPFLWDVGYENSFVVRSVKDAVELASSDFKVFTSYLGVRYLAGSEDLFGELRLALQTVRPKEFLEKIRANADTTTGPAPVDNRDLYAPEPNIKDDAGGLRDYHAAMWLYRVTTGLHDLDELVGNGYITADEHIELLGALDHLWRIRNALHFQTSKREDTLSFEYEAALAVALGYTSPELNDTTRFMQDYYAAARVVNRFFTKACHRGQQSHDEGGSSEDEEPQFSVREGEMYGRFIDDRWFEENPARLMAVFHEMSRRDAVLSSQLSERISENLILIGDAFRESPIVRRFFVAACSRPLNAGRVLRAMAETGVLERYIPEFGEVRDIVRYEDFHHYPVDEHTIRAVEALEAIPELEGRVGEFLMDTLERVQDPHILVLGLLCHDLGKASGEDHSDEGARLAWTIGGRMGLPDEDSERIAFLVQHHLLMTHIALYRDTDDMGIMESFAKTMRTENRLRYLILLSYADMSAVGPNVWNDWKGSLLLSLFLRAERVLLGHAAATDATMIEHPKTNAIAAAIGEGAEELVKAHLMDLGISYFQAFSVHEITLHLQVLAEAREHGFACAAAHNDENNTTDIVVCTRDHPGLFEEISGSFASELVDIERSMLYTCDDGLALDQFTVVSGQNRTALTEKQQNRMKSVLKQVIVDEVSVDELLEKSRRRVFGVLHPQAPMPTQIELDNDDSQQFTIVDVIAGDRTGLLYDIAHAFREQEIDVARAHIVTDARRVRDSFYVSCQERKLKDLEYKELESALRAAIQSNAMTTAL